MVARSTTRPEAVACSGDCIGAAHPISPSSNRQSVLMCAQLFTSINASPSYSLILAGSTAAESLRCAAQTDTAFVQYTSPAAVWCLLLFCILWKRDRMIVSDVSQSEPQRRHTPARACAGRSARTYHVFISTLRNSVGVHGAESTVCHYTRVCNHPIFIIRAGTHSCTVFDRTAAARSTPGRNYCTSIKVSTTRSIIHSISQTFHFRSALYVHTYLL